MNFLDADGLRVIAGGLVSMATAGAILAVMTKVSSAATFVTVRVTVRVPTRWEIVMDGELRFEGWPRV